MQYETHFNGGKGYRVTLDKKSKRAVIEKIDYDFDTETQSYEKLFEIVYAKVFVGKSPLNDMTKFSCAHGPEFEGNSILFELSRLRYLFVGTQVMEFCTSAPIVEFISPVGYSDVPYPFAIDSLGHRYLMLERISFSTDSYNPYVDFYNRRSAMTKLELWTHENKSLSVEFAATIEHHDVAKALRERKPLFIEKEPGQKVAVNEAQILQALADLGGERGYSFFASTNVWSDADED